LKKTPVLYVTGFDAKRGCWVVTTTSGRLVQDTDGVRSLGNAAAAGALATRLSVRAQLLAEAEAKRRIRSKETKEIQMSRKEDTAQQTKNRYTYAYNVLYAGGWRVDVLLDGHLLLSGIQDTRYPDSPTAATATALAMVQKLNATGSANPSTDRRQ